MKALVPRAEVVIRDLDTIKEEAEVSAALEAFSGEHKGGGFKINLARANRWGKKMPYVEL